MRSSTLERTRIAAVQTSLNAGLRAPSSSYPGWVRSVNRGMGFDPESFGWTIEQFEAATQSTHLIGRTVAHLAADPDVLSESGATLYAGDLALVYGFTDIDGRVPDYDGNNLLT